MALKFSDLFWLQRSFLNARIIDEMEGRQIEKSSYHDF
jgi:hypothetical protein